MTEQLHTHSDTGRRRQCKCAACGCAWTEGEWVKVVKCPICSTLWTGKQEVAVIDEAIEQLSAATYGETKGE